MSAARSLPMLPRTEDVETCARCGGKCCKALPGILAPEDVGAPNRDAMVARLVQLLRTGRYAIDWWEGDPRVERRTYEDDEPEPEGGWLSSVEWVRPAVKGYEGQLRHPTWGGPCTFLGPKGCEHAYDDRPHNCRALVPNPAAPSNGSCSMPAHLQKRDYVLMWLPYSDVLDEVQDLIMTPAKSTEPVDAQTEKGK